MSADIPHLPFYLRKNYNQAMSDMMEQSFREVPLVVLDTETTGLNPGTGHRVVEIGAVRIEPDSTARWKVSQQFSQLLQPGRQMDPGASRVNGIFDSDLIGAPSFADIATQILDMTQGALLVAHNARFDADFLGMEFHILRSSNQDDSKRNLPNPWLCTLRLARQHFYFGRNNLGNVARMLGVRSGRSHRALNDALTTLDVFKKMTVQLEELRLETVGDYLHAQGGAIYAPAPSIEPISPSLLALLQSKRPLRICYESETGRTERVVNPLFLTEREGKSFLIAHCRLRAEQRTFRVDRIISAEAA